LTIVVDDAGIGDLLFGVVIGAFRCETQEFGYGILDVKYFRPPRFRLKEYLKQRYGADRIHRINVTGEPQRLTEIAYLDELRNLGYEPVEERDKKRAKSFFHMMNWLEKNPDKLIYAKSGWPRLSKYRLFKSYRQTPPNEIKKDRS